MNSKKLPILELGGEYFPKKGEIIIVAVSGGPDSVALLYTLMHEVAQHGWELVVAHFDHQLRVGSKKDSEFVKDLAKSLGFKFVSNKKDVKSYAKKNKLTTEEAARDLRYEFLKEASKRYKAKAIALAHTADDQVETVVLNWLRGGLVRALSGMQEWDGQLWRPFLKTYKKDILAFLKAYKIIYREDKSNQDQQYTRNRVRKQVLPVLGKVNPNFSKVVLRNANTFGTLNELLEDILEITIKNVVSKKGEKTIEFKKSEFLALSEYLQNELFLWAIAELKGDRQDIKQIHLEEAKKVITSNQKKSWKQLPERLFVASAYDKISLSCNKPNQTK
ncbi:MAG: tRNA lysidine(34) synthetase TilS [Patescibacteria group bacterium]|nr:tRNA lysidine(34) synthetase TilS [Patescibacteria group bacterium]